MILLIDWDGFEDDFVVAFDAWEFEAVGLGSVGEFLVVFVEGISEAVDIDFRGPGDKGLSADEETGQEINTRGLDDSRHQVGKSDLCGVALVIIAQGAELGKVATVGDRQGGNL